jgi:hypothetical protein
MHGLSPESKDKADQAKQAAAAAREQMIEQTAELRSHEPDWIAQALSSHVFESTDPELNAKFDQALVDLMHNGELTLVSILFDAAMAKAEQEIDSEQPAQQAA